MSGVKGCINENVGLARCVVILERLRVSQLLERPAALPRWLEAEQKHSLATTRREDRRVIHHSRGKAFPEDLEPMWAAEVDSELR